VEKLTQTYRHRSDCDAEAIKAACEDNAKLDPTNQLDAAPTKKGCIAATLWKWRPHGDSNPGYCRESHTGCTS